MHVTVTELLSYCLYCRHSLWTHNKRTASYIGYSNSSHLLTNNIMRFNNFKGFVDIWTQHSQLLLMYEYEALNELIGAQMKSNYCITSSLYVTG
jgi:hypothetical protein